MSGHELPFHIQEEIMKRLPVKSLVQFRSVSKAWKSLIDSSHFIAAHSCHRHTHPHHHLLVSFREEGTNYASFPDDETLFQQRPLPNCPLYVQQNRLRNIVGISHGLVCLNRPGTTLTVIWNPSIRKFIVVDVPDPQFVGFGVCPVTHDPKIVTLKQSWDEANMETSFQCEAMVYTLSSGKWRSLSTNLPTKPIKEWWEAVAADGFIYWLGWSPDRNMTISFDLTNETFQMIDLPTTLASHDRWTLRNFKIRGSLAILQYDMGTYTVWMMEGGFQRSFTKLFTIHSSPTDSLIGFTKSGVPILRVFDDGKYKLVVYEPNSQHNNLSKISGFPFFLSADSYLETLFLLGRSDCSSY